MFRTASAVPDAPPFLFVTGYGDIGQAVRLMRNGAGDYITKPFEMVDFLSRVETAPASRAAAGSTVLGVSPQMVAIERTLRRMSALSAPVLLTGETGAGKEVCARYLHGLRAPKPGPFIAVNCAAIPKDLMESELFGHERGAFTGATSRHHGYAERARDGTLFLDEIGELDLKLQAKLLRLLEDRAFHRVGGEAAGPLRRSPGLRDERRSAGASRRRARSARISLPHQRAHRFDPAASRDGLMTSSGWRERFFEAFAAEAGVELTGISGHAMEELRAYQLARQRARAAQQDRARGGARARAMDPAWRSVPGKVRAEVAMRKVGSLEAARDEAEKREIQRALRHSGGASHRSRTGARHLPHHDVGEDAPPRDRAGIRHLRMFGFPNIGARRRPDSRTMARRAAHVFQ